jgi:hypothetical protein
MAGTELAPARCKPGAEIGLVGGAEADPESVEVGDAVNVGEKIAVGLLRTVGGQRVGSVALVSADAKSVSVVDLGAPFGDADPPKPFVRGGELFAGFYSKAAVPARTPGKVEATRTLAVLRIDVASSKAERLGTVTQQDDESPAFDVALGKSGGMVAWDEDAQERRPIGSPPRSPEEAAFHGVVKVMPLGADGKPTGTARVVSAETTDADTPRVVLRPGGFWLAWVARRPEPRGAAGAEAKVEGPGARATYAWIEAMPLDGAGAPAGPVRRLTSPTGHVSVFDLAAHGSEVELFARDDDQANEGVGGKIVRITLRPDAVEPSQVVVTGGAGEGEPEPLARPGTTPEGTGATPEVLAFLDLGEHLRIVPLRDGRIAAGAPSVEEALEDGRPLGLTAKGEIVAVYAKKGRPVGVVPCDVGQAPAK